MTIGILFRGKRTDTGEWVQGSLLTYSGCGCFICQRVFGMAGVDCSFMEDYRPDCFKQYEVDSATVGQYTGLTDKNGKRIFEGDIIKVPNWNCYGVVKYNVPECAFFIEMTNGDFVPMHDFASDVEVIGKIYDNPEILEST